MTFASLSEYLLQCALALLLLTTVTLGAGLLLVRIFKLRWDAVTETLMLRATFVATLIGILLAFVPMPRPQFLPVAPVAANGPSRPPAETDPISVTQMTGPAVAATPAPTLPLPLPLPVILVSTWFAISAVLLGQLIVGCIYIARLGNRALAHSPHSPQGSLYWNAFARARRQPDKIVTVESANLFLADLPLIPTFLALPQNADTRFTPSELEAILAHERSHLERWDGRWNFAAQIFCCLLWFHPLTWLLLRTMERDSEAASDEAALSHTQCTVREYIEMLLHFAESSQGNTFALSSSLRGISPLLNRPLLVERIKTLMNRPPLPSRLILSARLRVLVVCGLAALTLGSVSLFGLRGNAAPQQQPTVSLNLIDSDPIEALQDVLRRAGMRLAEGDLQKLVPRSKMTIRMTLTPVPSAIKTLLKVMSPPNHMYACEIKGKTVHITSLPLDKNGLPLKKITLQYGPGTLRGAVEEMLRGTGFEVNMASELRMGKRLNLQDVPLSEALPALLNEYPDFIRWSIVNGTIFIQANQEVQQANESTVQKLTKKLTLDFRKAPIREALEQLFQAAGVSYSLDNGVSGIVTLKIEEKPATDALTDVLKQSANPLEFVIENGVIIVRPKP